MRYARVYAYCEVSLSTTASPHWLAELVSALHPVTTHQELTDVLLQQAVEHLGLSTVWLYRKVPTDDRFLRLAAVSGTAADHAHTFHRVPIHGDPMLEALCRGEGPFAFEDVQTIPGLNREVTETLGNRALLNAPLVTVGDAIAILGAGTFRDEGPRVMDATSVDRWMQVVAVASAVYARIHLLEKEVERRRLEERVAQRQRLESIGELAGGVAHDLNSLLMVITSSLDFIRQEGLNETQRADAETVQSAVASATNLTRQLLALGRRSPMVLEVLDVRDVLDRASQLLRRLLPASIQMERESAARPLKVLGDASSLEQVMLNLAINARDAMPDGGRLTWELEQVVVNGEFRKVNPWAKPGRYALVTVTDTGTGMPADVRSRIFDPFFTTKAADKGSGLGLAVVYGIVEQHQGMLHCYSEVAVGTTFKVYLPIAEQDAAEVGAKLDEEVRGGEERVLVVDDTEQIRHLLRRILGGAGYHVSTAEHGEEALELARAKPYDLYMVDAVMPVMGGRRTIEALRQLDPSARILLVSGYGTEALSAAFLRDLSVPALPKPFDPDTLLRAVRGTLDE